MVVHGSVHVDEDEGRTGDAIAEVSGRSLEAVLLSLGKEAKAALAMNEQEPPLDLTVSVALTDPDDALMDDADARDAAISGYVQTAKDAMLLAEDALATALGLAQTTDTMSVVMQRARWTEAGRTLSRARSQMSPSQSVDKRTPEVRR